MIAATQNTEEGNKLLISSKHHNKTIHAKIEDSISVNRNYKERKIFGDLTREKFQLINLLGVSWSSQFPSKSISNVLGLDIMKRVLYLDKN